MERMGLFDSAQFIKKDKNLEPLLHSRTGFIFSRKLDKHKIFNIIFILFAVRIFFLILVPPFIGIANNGDFQRLMQSVGLDYPCDPWLPENYDTYFWRYITNDARFIEPLDTGWHQIFTVFPQIAIFLSNKIYNGFFDIRFLGTVNACVYLLGIKLIVNNIEQIKGGWSYVFLALTMLIFGDSYILQYFNSFYTEPGSISGIILFWGLLWAGFTVVTGTHYIFRILFLIVITIDALFVILSKQQDILLVVPVVFIVWLLLKRFNAKILLRASWSITFVTFVVFLFLHNPGGGNIGAFNAISMDLLSRSSNPQMHLREMGFNDIETEIFTQGIGGNMYSVNAPFSNQLSWDEYEHYFSRRNELKIILREPSIFFKMLESRSEHLFRDEPNLGNYMQDSGAAPYEKTKENRLWSNIKSAIYESNFAFYAATIFFSCMLSVFGWTFDALATIPKDLFLLYSILPVSNAIRFISVLLGDSSHDDIKHFFVLNVEFDVMFVINICAIVCISAYRLHRVATKK